MSIIYRVRNNIANPQTTTRPNIKSKTQTNFTAQQAFRVATTAVGFTNIINNIAKDEQSAWVATETTFAFTNQILLPSLLTNAINKIDDLLIKTTSNTGSKAIDNLTNTKTLRTTSKALKTLKWGIPIVTQVGLSVSRYYRRQNQINRKTQFQKVYTGAIINKR